MDKSKDKTKTKMFQDALIDSEDFLKNIIQKFCQDILEEEMEKHLGAKKYERSISRSGHRNGYKPRALRTRVGTLNLLVPQDREGNFSTELFNRYQRSEKALVLTLMEMYIKGISTRKVSDITEKLCGISFSSTTISALTSKLDGEISLWKSRPIKKEYPYLFIDTTYIRSRVEGAVISQGASVVVGIDKEGYREILIVEVIDTETFEAYDRIFKSLKDRGLSGVKLVISCYNKALRKAIEENFTGVLWQRCTFHFTKNILDLAPRKLRKYLAGDLKAIFSLPTRDEALGLAANMAKRYAKYPGIEEMLTFDILDALAFTNFPVEHRKRIRTVNLIERLNGEIKRRTAIVRIFPNPSSAARLITSICMEQNEEWISERKYLNMEYLKNYELPGFKSKEYNVVALT